MISKMLAILLVLLALAPVRISAQVNSGSGTNRQAPPASASPAVPGTKSECQGAGCEDQQPHLVVTVPPPAPAPWRMQDRVAWAANVLLALFGYAGIMVALFTLRKIGRQTQALEAVATAAVEQAQAALASAQAILNSERPWLLIAVEASLAAKNSFTVTVTNRGKTPAEILGMVDVVAVAPDENHLPAKPEYGDRRPAAPMFPLILVPGESAPVKSFSRDDLKSVCGSEERLKRVEDWEEKIFLYGRIRYKDLTAPSDCQPHETHWCCWYIHGRQKSGLVPAGPPSYNRHS